MADRAAYGGDPDFVTYDVASLTSAAHIAAIRADCTGRPYPPEHHAPPVAPVEDHGTLHVSVIDGEGLAVALTSTINTSFGSQVVATKSGIILNNEMDDFATRPALAVGASGGPFIITATSRVIENVLAKGMSVADAAMAPPRGEGKTGS